MNRLHGYWYGFYFILDVLTLVDNDYHYNVRILMFWREKAASGISVAVKKNKGHFCLVHQAGRYEYLASPPCKLCRFIPESQALRWTKQNRPKHTGLESKGRNLNRCYWQDMGCSIRRAWMAGRHPGAYREAKPSIHSVPRIEYPIVCFHRYLIN